jgi:hypothetical protein
VTRGTRSKKPSFSRGFAREARGTQGTRGTRGSWGLKTENQIFFFSFPAGNNYQQQPKLFRASARTQPVRTDAREGASEHVRRARGREGGREGGREEQAASADWLHLCGRLSASMRIGSVHADALVRPCGRVAFARTGSVRADAWARSRGRSLSSRTLEFIHADA